jgi:hypothetical protein
MARRETSLSTTLLYIVGIRHTLMLPGIDADMREFGQSGIRKHERELLAANADEIDTLLTMLKLRDDWQGPRNGVASAMDFVEGRDAGTEAGALREAHVHLQRFAVRLFRNRPHFQYIFGLPNRQCLRHSRFEQSGITYSRLLYEWRPAYGVDSYINKQHNQPNFADQHN